MQCIQLPPFRHVFENYRVPVTPGRGSKGMSVLGPETFLRQSGQHGWLTDGCHRSIE